jgi:hypothetical protein
MILIAVLVLDVVAQTEFVNATKELVIIMELVPKDHTVKN